MDMLKVFLSKSALKSMCLITAFSGKMYATLEDDLRNVNDQITSLSTNLSNLFGFDLIRAQDQLTSLQNRQTQLQQQIELKRQQEELRRRQEEAKRLKQEELRLKQQEEAKRLKQEELRRRQKELQRKQEELRRRQEEQLKLEGKGLQKEQKELEKQLKQEEQKLREEIDTFELIISTPDVLETEVEKAKAAFLEAKLDLLNWRVTNVVADYVMVGYFGKKAQADVKFHSKDLKKFSKECKAKRGLKYIQPEIDARRFKEDMPNDELTRLALSTLFRFFYEFYATPNKEEFNKLQKALNDNDLKECCSIVGNAMWKGFDNPDSKTNKEKITVVNYLGESLEEAFLKIMKTPKMYISFLEALCNRMFFPEKGEISVDHSFRNKWPLKSILEDKCFKNLFFNIFENLEALVWVKRTEKVPSEIKESCDDIARNLLSCFAHFSHHCYSGRMSAMKNMLGVLMKSCFKCLTAQDSVFYIWSRYCSILGEKVTQCYVKCRNIDSEIKRLTIIPVQDEYGAVYISFKYINAGGGETVISYDYMNDNLTDFTNDAEFSTIEGSLPAILGGWKDVPDNFYGCHVQSKKDVVKGRFIVISAMLRAFFLYGYDPLLARMNKSVRELMEWSEKKKRKKILYKTDDDKGNVVKFVQYAFESCFDVDFMLSQLIVKPGKPTCDDELCAFCENFVTGLIGNGATVKEKRNALRYLFNKYRFIE